MYSIQEERAHAETETKRRMIYVLYEPLKREYEM